MMPAELRINTSFQLYMHIMAPACTPYLRSAFVQPFAKNVTLPKVSLYVY